ncbi:MAG: hypothetical protein M3178_14620 [Pseudomonadota bacterium]|nr:hypothetical protein [Pseudomonadota bacterium]
MPLFGKYLRAIGVCGLIDHELPDPGRAAGYSPSAHVAPLVLMLAGGGLQAKAGPQHVNRCVFRRLLRTGERTGSTLVITATRIVADKREAHITCKAGRVIRQFINKRIFVQRSVAGPRHEIFSIADRGPARIARKTRTFGDSLKRKSRRFYLPPNVPDRNPRELA